MHPDDIQLLLFIVGFIIVIIVMIWLIIFLTYVAFKEVQYKSSNKGGE